MTESLRTCLIAPPRAVGVITRRAWLAALVVMAWAPAAAQTLPPAAAELARLINAYRAESGLPAVPLSPSLNRVAEAHARDLARSTRGDQCTLHSWSSAGRWTPCCYTRDGALAQCMWDKPRELTRGRYTGKGYEIAYTSTEAVTPELALLRWRDSPHHHEVILNRGTWSSMTWRAMGVALTDRHALVWFGEVADLAARR